MSGPKNQKPVVTANINSYVVELFRWNSSNNVYEKKDDCTMTLNLDTGDFTVVSAPVSGSPEQKYIGVNIVTDNFAIVSRERQRIASLYNLSDDLTIDYEMRFESHRFGIRFDARSSASETNFFNEYQKLRSKCQFVERYASGRTKIEGTKTESGYNGFCVEYYDKEGSPIKYMGEYEDGKYDGEGEFFSADGNIRISCKNICSGKPNGLGRLVVGRNRITKIIEMKEFHDIGSASQTFTNNVYSRLEPQYDELMELLGFEQMTLENRTMYLFRQLQKLKTQSSSGSKQIVKPFFSLF